MQNVQRLIHGVPDAGVVVLQIVGSERLNDHCGHIHVSRRAPVVAVDPAALVAGAVQEEVDVFGAQRRVALVIRLGIQRHQRIGDRVDALRCNCIVVAQDGQSAFRGLDAQRGHSQRNAGVVGRLRKVRAAFSQRGRQAAEILRRNALGIRAVDHAAAGQRQRQPCAVGAADADVVRLVQVRQHSGKRVAVLNAGGFRQLFKGSFRVKKGLIIVDLFFFFLAQRAVCFECSIDSVTAVGRYHTDGVDLLNDALRIGYFAELTVTAEVDIRERLLQVFSAGFKAHALCGHVFFQCIVAAIVFVMEAQNSLIPALRHIRVAP